MGGYTTLVATVSPAEAVGKVIGTVSWSSSNNAVAKVVNGLVTGVSVGSADITATVGTLTSTCKFTVSEGISSIKLSKTIVSLPVDSILTLSTDVPNNLLSGIVWTSTNPSVATVDSNGKITALSIGSSMVGTTNIVASIGTATAICALTVTPNVTGLSLKSSMVVPVGYTRTITASFLPLGAKEGAVSWSSSNPAIATVSGVGAITGISNGTTNITATFKTFTASCAVTVKTIPASMMGSNYYLINLNSTDYNNYLGSDLISGDYREDKVNNNFYVWAYTFTAGTCSGTSFYGSSTSWVSMVVASVGWSGAAYNIKNGTELDKLKAVTDDTSGKYYLHFAIKSSTTNSYAFKVGYGTSSVTIVLGPDMMESTAPYSNFTRNGQWQEVEIPVSYLKSKGLTYTTGMATTDVFAMLAGGVTGTKFEIDAIFIYKKP